MKILRVLRLMLIDFNSFIVSNLLVHVKKSSYLASTFNPSVEPLGSEAG